MCINLYKLLDTKEGESSEKSTSLSFSKLAIYLVTTHPLHQKGVTIREMRNIRIQHEWGVTRQPKFGTQFTSKQLCQLKHMQEVMLSNGLKVSMAVLIRAGVVSLLERIEQELIECPDSGLAIVTRMLELAAEQDTPFELPPLPEQGEVPVPFWNDRINRVHHSYSKRRTD